MNKVKEFAKGLIYGHKKDSDTYIEYLKKQGASVGEDVTIYVPTKTVIDECYPWMIEIGNHVRITQGVVILCHDYSWSVLKSVGEGVILGASGKVHIGNNVFVGMNAIITRNVTIGDNVIIGAGSVVTKDCQPNGVYAGNPARRIAEIDEFLEKRRRAQIQEAKDLAQQYYHRFAKYPSKEIFHEFFMLFDDVKIAQTQGWSRKKMELCGNYEESISYLSKSERPFKDYEEFLDYCFPKERCE